MSETKDIEIGDVKVTFPLNASDRLYTELQNIIGNGKITRSNIVIILLSLIQSVENYEDVKGSQKKAIILDVLNHFIEGQIEDQQEEIEMKLLVQLTIPSIIDTFIGIDKKKIRVKLRKSLLSCCGLA